MHRDFNLLREFNPNFPPKSMAQTVAVDLVIEWGEVFDSNSKDHNTQGDICLLGVYLYSVQLARGENQHFRFRFVRTDYLSLIIVGSVQTYVDKKMAKFPFSSKCMLFKNCRDQDSVGV